MSAGAAVYQLCGYPQPLAGTPQAALKHVADAEILGHLPDVNSTYFVDERRISGDHCETGEAAKRSDDVINHAIGKVVLLRIAAEIGEGQDGQRGSDRGINRTQRRR